MKHKLLGRNKYTLYHSLIRQRWKWLRSLGKGWMGWDSSLKLLPRIREEERKLYGNR